MQTPEFDLSSDCFILDRDQGDYLNAPQAQSTPRMTSRDSTPRSIQNVYEIIKTNEDHIVLYHETAPISILSTAQEDPLPIRRFTRNNPLILNGVFQSPRRDYDNIASWLFHSEDGTNSPISNNSSSVGYFPGRTVQPTHPGYHTTL